MARALGVYCTLGALLCFAGIVFASMAINGGVFEYPLDDVYIHMAMAEQWFRGGYGVNAGEFASAASSILYPAFLPPLAGFEIQFWLPLFWNVVALVLAALLLARGLEAADLGAFGIAVALVAPFALSMHVTAFTGMENMAHGAASLAIVLGLWNFAREGGIGWLLILGVALSPLLRMEGAALALAAAGMVAVLGRPGAGFALACLAVLPVAMFAVWLTSLGLDPLPNSVNAKMPSQDSSSRGFLSGLGNTFAANIATYGGRFVIAMTVVVWILSMAQVARDSRAKGYVGLAVALAAVAHLALASTGWMDRYENYLVLSLFTAMALLLADWGRLTRIAVLGAVMLGGVATYLPWLGKHIVNPRAIHLQQAEMSRFAKDHVQAAVAVNDLGYIAWNNPNYVLDLWGLASSAALEARKSKAPDGWADTLADVRGVRVAMIYDHVIAEALGPDWVLLGRLRLLDHKGAFLGGDTVSFYARNAVEAQGLQADLKDWAAGLPEGTQFDWAEGEAS